MAPTLQRDFRRVDVTVADHGNLHGFGHRGDHLPVGFARVALGAGASMHGESLDARVFKMACVVHGIDRLGIPPSADFRGDWKRRDSTDHSRGDGGEESAVAQEGGAAVFADHFVDRAAEVDVDEVWLLPVDDGLRAAGELVGVSAEKLDPERALLHLEVDVMLRPLVAMHDSLGRDKFGGEDVGSACFADAAEDGVGHPGHGREVKRRTFRTAGEAGGACLFHGNDRRRGRRRYRAQAASPSCIPSRADTSACTSGTWARLSRGLGMRKVSPVPTRS